MSKRVFEVEIHGTVRIAIDEKVIERALSPEWQKDFYRFDSIGDAVEHIAYNMLVNDATLKQLDGFADLEDDGAKLEGRPDWNVTATAALKRG